MTDQTEPAEPDLTGVPGYYDPEGNPASFEQVCAYLESDQRVALDNVTFDGHLLIVSTVYLGIDHGFGQGGPPIIYETIIFKDDHEEIGVRRYATREEAALNHAVTVEELVHQGGVRSLDPRAPFEEGEWWT